MAMPSSSELKKSRSTGTGRRQSAAMKLVEELAGGPLTLGNTLEAIRLGEEMSQVVFARKLGLSKQHLCDIEKGRKLVSPERAVRFAKVLGYSTIQFIEFALQDQLREAGLRFKINIEAA
jgi:antitoxin HigA-1